MQQGPCSQGSKPLYALRWDAGVQEVLSGPKQAVAKAQGEGMKPIGRPPKQESWDGERSAYMEQYGLTYAHPRRELTETIITQLRMCADDEARRLILGVSQ